MNEPTEKMDVSKALLKGGAIVTGVNLFGKLTRLGLKLVLANALGIAVYGLFELLTSITRLFAIIGQMGLHQSIVRFFSLARSHKNREEARGSFRTAVFSVITLSLILSGGILIFRDSIGALFNVPADHILLVVWASVLLPLVALRQLFAYGFRGLNKLLLQSMFLLVLQPLGTLAGATILLAVKGPEFSLYDVYWASLVCLILVVLAGWTGIEKVIRNTFPESSEPSGFRSRKMLAYSMPVWFNTVMGTSLVTVDRIMLGALSVPEQVGLYSAAYSLAILLNLAMTTFIPAYQSMISDAYVAGDTERMQDLFDSILRFISLMLMIILGGIVIYGKQALQLFGEGFEGAFTVLILLAVAEALNALAGPAGFMLNMCEKQKVGTRIVIIGFGTAIILNALLIPKYMALGAAVGTGASLIIINILRFFAVRSHFRIKLRFPELLKLYSVSLPVTALLYILVFQLGVHIIWMTVIYLSAVFALLACFTTASEKQMLLRKLRRLR